MKKKHAGRNGRDEAIDGSGAGDGVVATAVSSKSRRISTGLIGPGASGPIAAPAEGETDASAPAPTEPATDTNPVPVLAEAEPPTHTGSHVAIASGEQTPGEQTAADAPVSDDPAPETPEAEGPAFDVAEPEVPSSDAPVLDAPALDAPEFDAPEFDASELDSPDSDAPESEIPEAETSRDLPVYVPTGPLEPADLDSDDDTDTEQAVYLAPRTHVAAHARIEEATVLEPIPDTTSIDVALPSAPQHEAPADEVAVAIPEVPIDPVIGAPTFTRSIDVVPTVSGPVPKSAAVAASTGLIPTVSPVPVSGSAQTTRRSAYDALLGATDAPGGPVAASAATTSSPVPTGPSRRERLRAEQAQAHSPESSAMLTPDRLLEVNRKTKPRPTGGWNKFLYAISFHGINRGDSAKVKAWKELDERISRSFEGGTRFVPVLTRKGGVGKTTVTTLLGMALADAREDRIIAIDANPDRGTLSERVNKQTRATVRDVVTRASEIREFTEFSTLVSRDDTRLDILASDTDPQLSEAFDEDDYNVVADLVEQYYSIMLTDCGTGIVHSVMRATLQRADSVVIVSGGSVDEARLASETLTWLDANGYGALVRNAVVALNTATQGTNLVKLDEIESHFSSRVRAVVRIPYDPQLAAGTVVKYVNLKPATKAAARQLAALVVEGLPVRRTHS